MPEQTPPALIHAGRRGGKLARLIAVETARGAEPEKRVTELEAERDKLARLLAAESARVAELEIEREMWRERAERGQLHRDQLVDQLNAARARIAELEAQQQPRVITDPADADALPDERCVSCGLGIADDRYRDLDGDVWHGECFTQWCDAQEEAARDA